MSNFLGQPDAQELAARQQAALDELKRNQAVAGKADQDTVGGVGGILGGIIGAYFGGPAGAVQGYGIGSQLGSGVAQLADNSDGSKANLQGAATGFMDFKRTPEAKKPKLNADGTDENGNWVGDITK